MDQSALRSLPEIRMDDSKPTIRQTPKSGNVVAPARPDQLLSEQRQRWRGGDRPPVEAYRHAHPTLCSAREIVLELIFNEITLRAEDGETPELEEYLGRFPELAQELVLQFETDRTANGTPSADF